jgi:hypothetical protein
VFGQRTLGQGVKFADALALLDPGIPLGLGTLVEPGADLSDLLGRKFGDGSGDRLDGVHGHSHAPGQVSPDILGEAVADNEAPLPVLCRGCATLFSRVGREIFLAGGTPGG